MLCSDENLFLAIANPTAYCEIFGELHIAVYILNSL